MVGRRESSRPGWVDVEISLRPGETVWQTIRDTQDNPEGLARLLDLVSATYNPAGGRLDLFAER